MGMLPPCHDTFRRVLSHVNPDELHQCFISWPEALRTRRE
jgi:DDE family transposase